jgi:hypothetical protein
VYDLIHEHIATQTALRVLFVLPQMPQDPSSGAARSTTICEMLAESGMAVRALATTATESVTHIDPLAYLRSLGCDVQVARGRMRPELSFIRRGIDYRLIDVGRRRPSEWQNTQQKQFDLAFDDGLHAFRPDILFTFGGLPGDIRRQHRARRGL